MWKKLMTVCALACAVLAGGCASVPMATPEQDAAARTYTVKPGKANIYVYRNETFGAALKMPIVLDGRLMADTAANTFMVLEVAPGPHVVISKTENEPKVTINAVAGRNYFLWQEVKMGAFAARSELHQVDDATGKKGVAECKLIELPKY